MESVNGPPRTTRCSLRTVHKFVIYGTACEIKIPREAKFLCAGYQKRPNDDRIAIACWYELNTEDKDLVKKTLVYVGTGSDVDLHVSPNGVYVGTVHATFHTPYVWHVYEELGWRSERENRNAKN